MILQIGEKSFSSVIFEAKGIKKIKKKNQFQPKTNTRFIWLVLNSIAMLFIPCLETKCVSLLDMP